MSAWMSPNIFGGKLMLTCKFIRLLSCILILVLIFEIGKYHEEIIKHPCVFQENKC
eukprot:m.18375 g.18375  ORF g.18375 m.18375 type:complete len:56 (+) comp6296_c0_seq2:750-917(+)